ncbi:MAG: hypothetical protein L7F78_22155 [Syntrophales bacterium LBB04]|nr:hypothetical protein [Syntrophales bacterium LBB04]
MTTGMMAVTMIFGFPLLVVAGLFTIWALKITRGRDDDQRRDEETKLIQEIHQGLIRMDQRIEALETIILDRGGKEKP